MSASGDCSAPTPSRKRVSDASVGGKEAIDLTGDAKDSPKINSIEEQPVAKSQKRSDDETAGKPTDDGKNDDSTGTVRYSYS